MDERIEESGLSPDEQVLNRAKDRFLTLWEAEIDIKTEFEEDTRFAYNIDDGQWEDADIKERTSQKPQRPYLTMNKIHKFISQVVNAEKGMPNVDEIIPVDNEGDQEIADIYNELIQHIEYHSEATDAYSLAGEHAVSGGFGYWRILTQFEPDSFDQEIKIVPIKNPLMVSRDPNKKYAFIREALSKEDFLEKWPEEEMIDFENYSGHDDYELWYEDDTVFISEYFEKIPVKKWLIEYIDNLGEISTAKVDEIPKDMNIRRKRQVDDYKIMWYKISGTSVLEKKEWAGTEIPIVEVVGHEVFLLGKTYKRSLHRDAKDAQKMYNYWLTSMTEKVALAPKAPYLVTKNQISGHEAMWNSANVKNYQYLLYNQTGGQMPSRQPPVPIDPGSMTLLSIADQNIKDILGMYEASAGAPSNERSGKAIIARNARSDMGVFTFQDNLRKAKLETKKILIDLLPKIYDTQRVVRLRHKDSTIKINESVFENNEFVIKNDLSRGRYDIRVKDVNSPSRRQQTVDNIVQVMQYVPDFAGTLLPLALTNMDAPGSDEMVAVIQQQLQQQAQQPQGEK
jgi:hypothetical protein